MTARRSVASLLNRAIAARCYTDALQHEPGSVLASSGALAVMSGARTGRSPSDKRIVCRDSAPSKAEIAWGCVNIPLKPQSFDLARERALSFLDTQAKRKYVVDGFAGADPRHRLKIRVICSRAYHALFMQNMLIRPTEQQLRDFGEPNFTIYNAGERGADPSVEGVNSNTLIAIDFEQKEAVILGTEYAGEMKKGVFTIMHYLMPLKGILSLHSSANEGRKGDVSLFFGLSGTGKTTLSADPNRLLIGDDEHCWSDDGIFNIEGGCYAKAIDLSTEKEPEIFNAIKFGTILENVVLDPDTHVVDFTDRSITENTRVCYPINFIVNAKIPSIGSHPKNIIFLTCDAYGVLPAVSNLSINQAMYHFRAGYTSKIAGTEQGVTKASSTFSACFGAPFLVHKPQLYANMLAKKLQQHPQVRVWLLNTGWTGGPIGSGGERIPLKYSRAIIDAIHSGELDAAMQAHSKVLPLFDLRIPATDLFGVPAEVLDPVDAWRKKGKSKEQYMSALEELKGLFDEVSGNDE
ncbi:hypothetical protein HDU84_009489 [Entophlyctis sp. JEL0112]|nr:hypothetical protein HDU84_009489 [Entophlyctis sp. JEL0112]